MIFAEIGWNFLGDLSLAKKMILAAKDSKCKVVKFQLWDPKFLKPGPWDTDGRRQIYEKAYLDDQKFEDLYKFSIKNDLDCFASVFNNYDYDRLKQISNRSIKIPSPEVYDFKLIEKSLMEFENVYVSTGAMKFDELEHLKKYKSEKNFFPMHCVSIYPLDSENANFKKFNYLKENFEIVGYSGHCKGINDALFALSNGASFVEKHFTIDNKLEGRDNKFAITPAELKTLCEFENDIKKFNIDKGLDLQEKEKDVFNNYRGRWRK